MNGITSSGAKGINALGPRYMGKYHPLMEIGPRYLLIQGTHRELTEGNGPPFVLALPHIDRDILHHLQYDSMPGDKETWNDYCPQAGIDFSAKPMEVELSELYINGILYLKDNFETRTVKGLFGGSVFNDFSGSICSGYIAGDHAARAAGSTYTELPEPDADELAVGTLACSGTIGCLIPPSTTFIIYGVLAQQSIGDLFAAGIIPGLLCALCFMAAVWLMVFLKPGLAPRLPKSPLHERMASLKTGLPIMGIFFLVIGGIYGGVFTATEGGGIGAFGTLLLALCMRRMNGKNVIATLHDSAKFISMCFTVLCGAIVLSYFMAMTRIPMVLANSIAALDVAPMLVLFAIVMTFCILGCFLPSMPLLLICVPIFVPIAKVFGWDLIWFGVIITVLDNMASITVKSTDATHPQNGMSFGDLGETDLMEIGAGQHGEGGGVRVPMMSSKDTVATVAEALCKALDLKPGDKTFVMINGCGATTMMEMLVLFKDTVEFLKAKGIEVVASMVGEILTVQEAAGFQMNIAKWDEEMLRLWNTPCRTPAFSKE